MKKDIIIYNIVILQCIVMLQDNIDSDFTRVISLFILVCMLCLFADTKLGKKIINIILKV